MGLKECVILLSASIILCIFIIGLSIVNDLFNDEHYISIIFVLLTTIFLSIGLVNLVNGVLKTEKLSNSKIIVYTTDGNILGQYKGDISNVLYDDNYIKFTFENKEYSYQNCLVKMVKEE